jgi:hypothetical protein
MRRFISLIIFNFLNCYWIKNGSIATIILENNNNNFLNKQENKKLKEPKKFY